MLLADGDDLFEIFAAFNTVVLSGCIARTIQALAHGSVEDIENQ